MKLDFQRGWPCDKLPQNSCITCTALVSRIKKYLAKVEIDRQWLLILQFEISL